MTRKYRYKKKIYHYIHMRNLTGYIMLLWFVVYVAWRAYSYEGFPDMADLDSISQIKIVIRLVGLVASCYMALKISTDQKHGAVIHSLIRHGAMMWTYFSYKDGMELISSNNQSDIYIGCLALASVVATTFEVSRQIFNEEFIFDELCEPPWSQRKIIKNTLFGFAITSLITRGLETNYLILICVCLLYFAFLWNEKSEYIGVLYFFKGSPIGKRLTTEQVIIQDLISKAVGRGILFAKVLVMVCIAVLSYNSAVNINVRSLFENLVIAITLLT